MKTPQADGLPTPTGSCSRNELCQERLHWPAQASLLGLAVPLLLLHLASQSGIAQEASWGMNPGVSGTLTLLQKAWSCGGGSYLLSGWGTGGQSHVRAGSGEREVGMDPAQPRRPKDVGLERHRTEATRGVGMYDVHRMNYV